MLIEIFLAIVFGLLAGTLTGLTPGIHVNLVAFLLISYNDYIQVSVIYKIIFIVSMSITHTFVDSIPSIYFGVPDSSTVISVLPAHKMLLKGQAFEALKLTIIGSVFSLITIVFLSPLFLYSIPLVYPYIDRFMAYFLIIVVMFSILKVKTFKLKVWSFFVFLISGCLGFTVLDMINISQPLLPMLSGLFGVSSILLSMKSNTKLPAQIINSKVNLSSFRIFKSSFIATFSGSLTGLFPGLGAAQASLIGMQFMGHVGTRSLLVLVGGINTANFVFSLITLYSIQKARNGAVIAINSLKDIITFNDFFIIIASTLIVAVFATLITYSIGKKMSVLITKVNYLYLNIFILFIISLITFYFTGFIGLIVLIISTFVGLIAPLKGVAKSNAMGCLLLPAIIYFIFR